jgi:hypothetical protein
MFAFKVFGRRYIALGGRATIIEEVLSEQFPDCVLLRYFGE